MTILSRTFPRASRRGKKLMEHYQPPGAYEAAEKRYKLAQAAKKANKGNRLEVKPEGRES